MPGADSASIFSAATTAPTVAETIFPKGPSFTLDNFSSQDFIVKEFIESLSDSAVPTNRRSGASSQAFDPKPFIRTFEYALSRLGSLSEELEGHENELSAAVRRAELQHNQNVASLGKKLDQTIASFHRLDTSLNGSAGDIGQTEAGGNVAMRIGERLEELDRQRQRAQDARFLILCWLEISERGELASLEDVRRQGGSEGKLRCAHIARQLLRISQRLDPSSWGHSNGTSRAVNGDAGPSGRYNTKELIEKFLETLEKDLLKQFDDFYRKQSLEGMRECAIALRDFNGGASVVGLFVNQHQFFIDRSQLISEEVSSDAEILERLADPDAEPPGVEPSLQSLVDEVRIVVQEESFIIKRAFPYYELVLSKFLQRVFEQSIQQRLELVLQKANSISSMAYLRSLQASRSYIHSLVDDLKAHGLTEHPESISSQTSTVLDQQFDDLFVPYFVGSSYIEREKKSLEELYSSLLFKFTTYHARRRRVPTTFMASLAKSGSELLATARDAYIDRLDSSDLSPAQKAMLLRVAGLKEGDANQNKTDIEVSEQDGILSIPNAKRMLRWLAEAVGRSLELGGGSDTPKDVAALLNLLLANMGELYIETALDAANDFAASQENIKSEPDLSYLPDLRNTISVMHLMITCINTVLVPLAGSKLVVRRDMERTATLAINHMEEKVSTVMQRTIDVILAWVTKLLANQKKIDFRPKDSDGSSGRYTELLQTPPCLSIYTFVSRARDLASRAFDGKNLESFTSELAIGLRNLLLDHFKRFQVNAAGGLMVTKDATKYAELLRSFPLPSYFAPAIDVLPEIGNLFVIGPEALREHLRGAIPATGTGPSTSSAGADAGAGATGSVTQGASAGSAGPGGAGRTSALVTALDRNDLRLYIQRREDAGSLAVQSILQAL
ncbi:exocyst complex component Sec10 [Xylona heveae TC161]|uniref:Exocyst complex component Sec10 n=1 Tax=Xylona heveae (strain CBS 132557 / TC161) TaxID=1328760 RepID=A0A165HMF1_XYLHT|nr:exocyst complex component Sec10 [Xylona heveae TC161]KZF23733.1 exocyst complex component Sec10 [Xylona heveae TC161]